MKTDNTFTVLGGLGLWIAGFIMAWLLFGAEPVAASSASMRCGGYLISEGYHKALVKQLCGKPESVSTFYIHNGGYGRDLAVTEMVYNFGPRKFLRLLRFENGRLVSIELIGYGHN